MIPEREKAAPVVEARPKAQFKAGELQGHCTPIALTGNRCLCTSCGKCFSGEEHFDAHRVGDFEAGRRCMDLAEMVCAGFVRDDAGCWRVERRAQRAARHWCNGKTRPPVTVGIPTHRVGAGGRKNARAEGAP